MPDTGAPWNIPYVAGTDLVSDWPTDSQALANAVANGLDVAGGLVAVKSAIFTGTQSNSTAAGANFAVTDLSITHTLDDAANKLVISLYLGMVSADSSDARVGIAVADDGTLIGIGAANGSKTSVASVAPIVLSDVRHIGPAPSLTFVYAPGDTSSHTYTARVINVRTGTQVIYVNRLNVELDNAYIPRTSSSLVIQEVRV